MNGSVDCVPKKSITQAKLKLESEKGKKKRKVDFGPWAISS